MQKLTYPVEMSPKDLKKLTDLTNQSTAERVIRELNEINSSEPAQPENLMVAPETIQEKTVEFPIPPHSTGVQIRVAEDVRAGAVILLLVAQDNTMENVTLSLTGAHALAAALNRSANRIGHAQYKAGRKK